MKKILLVEDDQMLLNIIKLNLEESEYQVTTADNGLAAYDLIKSNNFDLIISDINMPKLTGLDLLKKIRADKIETPYILMTGHISDLMNNEIADLGVTDFLQKPFKSNQLLEAVEASCEKVVILTKNDDEFYSRIPINYFISAPNLKIDIFVKLNNEKMIRIVQSNESISINRVIVYKKKGVKYLYIKSSDLDKVNALNSAITQTASVRPNVKTETKLTLLNYCSEIVLDQVKTAGVFSEKNIVESSQIIDLLIKTQDLQYNNINFIDALSEYSDWLMAHSFGVSYMCILISKELGYISEAETKKLGLIGLVHDLGMLEVNSTILEQKYNLMTDSDKAIVNRHSLISRDYLSLNPLLGKDIIDTVAHHNDENIKDLPHNVRKFLEILSAADYFTYHTLKNPLFNQLSVQDTIQNMKNNLDDSNVSLEIRNLLQRISRKVS